MRGPVRLMEGESTHHQLGALMSAGVVFFSAMAEDVEEGSMRHVVSTLQAKGGFVGLCLRASDGESQASLVSTARHAAGAVGMGPGRARHQASL